MVANKGFSLVELSIVLVILGLLTGGILGGQSLMRAAELRAVSTEVQQHITAVQTFRDKYFALPGDMRNAVRFWGAQAGGTADGTDATCIALDEDDPATDEATCNGNGDGEIWRYDSMTGTASYESFRVWQHLANAGLITGTYAGVSHTPTGPGTDPGYNLPQSKLGSNVGYNLVFWGNRDSADTEVTNSRIIEGNYGHVLVFGLGDGFWYHAMGYGPVLKPEEAWNIDQKMDDGLAGGGKVMAPGTAVNGDCAETSTVGTPYKLSVDDVECGLVFKTGF